MSASLKELAERLAQVSDICAARNSIVRDDDWYALKIVEEAGELVAEHLRLTGRGRVGARPAAAIREARDDEAVDLLAMVILYCRDNDIDVEAALERKWFRHLGRDA
jgi:NTP pyrophosphatase (non-canonical NTP hydrolase)